MGSHLHLLLSLDSHMAVTIWLTPSVFEGTSLAELNIALGFDPAGVVGTGASGAAGGTNDEDY